MRSQPLRRILALGVTPPRVVLETETYPVPAVSVNRELSNSQVVPVEQVCPVRCVAAQMSGAGLIDAVGIDRSDCRVSSVCKRTAQIQSRHHLRQQEQDPRPAAPRRARRAIPG